jgi:hypothetical protein
MLIVGCGPIEIKIGGDKNKEEPTTSDTQIIGGDKDSHGCLISAGYSWCEIKSKCLRNWEEPCEKSKPQTTTTADITTDDTETQTIPEDTEPVVTEPVTTTPTETPEQCYEKSAQRIEDAYKANIAAMTWDSYWANIGADDTCNKKMRACTDARDEADNFDPEADPSLGIHERPLNQLWVEETRVCYNREVACNELVFKNSCGMTGQKIKEFPSVTESFCKDKYAIAMKYYRDYNIKANMESPMILSRIESCYNAYKSCADIVNAANTACSRDVTNGDYSACKDKYLTDMLACVTADLNCHDAHYADVCKTIASRTE